MHVQCCFKGIEKSCLMATIPTLNDKGVCMLDVGANAENTVDQLVQFAIMGNVYAKNVRHIQKPKVALLNIGSEEHKGDEIHKDLRQVFLRGEHGSIYIPIQPGFRKEPESAGFFKI